MIEDFKLWFSEIRDSAIKDKKAKALKNGNESNWRKEIWKSPEKNKAIKTRFRDEGEALGFRSRPSYVTNAGEWLYDFIWREFDDKENLKRVILTMEIEVSDKYIKYDFNKLLQADSEYKIMVFQLKHEIEINKMFSSLENAIKAYQSKIDSKYLLVGWCTSKNDFMFVDFTVQTDR